MKADTILLLLLLEMRPGESAAVVVGHDEDVEGVENGGVEVALADVGVDVGELTDNLASAHDATEAAHGLHQVEVSKCATALAEVATNGFADILVPESPDGR